MCKLIEKPGMQQSFVEQIMKGPAWKKFLEQGGHLIDTVGNSIANDESPEAKQLLAFLAQVYEANADKPMTTPREVGVAWFACHELRRKQPDSELAKTFDS